MKTKNYLLMLLFVNLSVLVSGVSREETAADSIESSTEIESKELLSQAYDWIEKRDYQKAKENLHQILEREQGSPPRPYVKDNTLYMYFYDSSEFIAFSTLSSMPDDKQQELKEKFWPEIIELEENESWGNVVYEHPTLPKACQALAYIAVEERRLEEAFSYLDKAIDYWPDYLEAKSEYVYILMRMNQFDKAKEMAQKILASHSSADKQSQSRLYRHLGFIAIEEKELDLAEEYFNQSLELTPGNPNALQELHYIEELRKKEEN